MRIRALSRSLGPATLKRGDLSLAGYRVGASVTSMAERRGPGVREGVECGGAACGVPGRGGGAGSRSSHPDQEELAGSVDGLPAKEGKDGKAQGQGGSKGDAAARKGRGNGGSLPAGETEGDHCGNRGEQDGDRQDEEQERRGAVVHECTALMGFTEGNCDDPE